MTLLLLPRPAPTAPQPPLAPTTFRVVRTQPQTADTHTLWVAGPDDEPPLTFAPGQFCMLYVPGIGEAAISISSADRDGNLLFTIRAVGGVTNALCAMRPGDQVGVRGPFGTAWPVDQARGHDLVIVAGGLGLAPLRPALEVANRDRRDYRSVTVLVGARTPGDLLFRRELLGWGGLPDIDVQIAVDRGDDAWPGRVGVVTQFIPGLEIEPEDTYALVCGPEIMMRFAARDLAELGVPDDRIFVSLERTMRCGVGTCGHCQLGPVLICRDGAVFPYSFAAPLMEVAEL
jgi:NAD(P)H-flavin reductase